MVKKIKQDIFFRGQLVVKGEKSSNAAPTSPAKTSEFTKQVEPPKEEIIPTFEDVPLPFTEPPKKDDVITLEDIFLPDIPLEKKQEEPPQQTEPPKDLQIVSLEELKATAIANVWYIRAMENGFNLSFEYFLETHSLYKCEQANPDLLALSGQEFPIVFENIPPLEKIKTILLETY